jgi:DNA primase
LNRLCAQNDANSDKGRNTILHDMAEAVHKTGNSVLIDTYAQKTALRLGVAPEAVRAEFKKVPAARTESEEGEAEPESGQSEPKHVRRIMNFIC